MAAESKEYNDNYIFFSYSHMNSAKAIAIVDSLRRHGFSVWYDDGVAPGVSWDDYIAERIENCTCFFAYVTEAYKKSSNCIDEISYARDRGKKIVLIYAEDAEKADFPKGLQMRLSAAEILRVSDYSNKSLFYRALFDVAGINVERSDNAIPDVLPGPNKVRRRSSSKRLSRRKIPILPIALILSIVGFFVFINYEISKETTSSQGMQSSICEMEFTLPDDSYVKETDRDKVFNNYRNLSIPARDRGEEVLEPEDFIDLQWYNGQGNEYVLVSAQAANYSNDEFEKAADAIVLDKVGTYKEFHVGSVKGRYGVEKVNSFTNTSIHCLNNGVFYAIVFMNTELEDDAISKVIESIDFDSAPDDQKITCGDISLTLPGTYHEGNYEWNDGRQDSHVFVQYTDALKEVIVYYHNSESLGSLSDIAKVYEDHYSAKISERDESFGKCYVFEMEYDENGTEYSEVMAIFEVSGKTYAVELISDKSDITAASIEDIISTIKVD